MESADKNNGQQDPDFISLLIAPLTLDRRILQHIKDNSSLNIAAIILMIVTRFLDFTPIEGINIRFNFETNNVLNPTSILIQPLLIYYTAFVMKLALSWVVSNEVETQSIFRLLGFTTVWTVVSFITYALLGPELPGILGLIVTVFFFFAYFAPIAVGVSRKEDTTHYVGLTILLIITTLVAIFLPIILIIGLLGI